MPLPHFLMMLVAVILAAGGTLWLALSRGVPLAVMALGGLVAAVVIHLAARPGDAGDGPRHHPRA